jgi:uncharacterized protein YgfB (UPF0149 family)
VRHYYAAIRRYRTNGDATYKAFQPALDSLLPLIREKVVAYYVLEAGDGVVASITICEDEEKLEATNRVATEWLKQYLASSIVSQQEVPNITLEVGETLKGPFTKRSRSPPTREACNCSRFQR